MQLILPQSELEQAITEYVHGIMNIKDGHTMTIDLKAGRGLDGFTATVDITKAGGTTPVKTVVPVATPRVFEATPVPPLKVTLRVEPKEEDTILVVNDPVAVPAAEVKAVDTKSEQPQAATVETETVAASTETEAATASPVRRPLFVNLKKPE